MPVVFMKEYPYCFLKVLVVFFISFVSDSVCNASELDADLLAGVVNRATSIQSGKFQFTLSRSFPGRPKGELPQLVGVELDENGKPEYKKLLSEEAIRRILEKNSDLASPPKPDGDKSGSDDWESDPRNESSPDQEMIVVVAGDEWTRRWVGFPNVEISRTDYDATYTVNENPDSTFSRNLLIEPQKTSIEDRFWEREWRRILRCGTVPTPEMLDFVSSHQNDAKLVGTKTVNGVETKVIEWNIPQDQYENVWHYVGPYLYSGRSAKLRLYVSEKYGFAVVRAEAASSTDEVKFWYESSDFKEVAKGIFFPYSSSMIFDSDPTRRIVKYVFHEISDVNQPIDEQEFELSVPKGTRVRNNLPGQQVVFEVGRDLDISISNFEKINENLRSNVNAAPASSSRMRLIVLLNLVLVVLIFIIYAGKKFISKKKSQTER